MTNPTPGTDMRRPGPGLPAGSGRDGKDWTVQLADAIDAVVGTARDKTVVPLRKVVRVVTRALLAAFLLGAAAVAFAVGAFRALDVVVPGGSWLAHLLLGGVFVLAGLLCFGRR